MKREIKKVLIANRGEIAVRIIRACHDLDISTVAIYSKEDILSGFRTKADEAYVIGETLSPLGAYLAIDEIVAMAKKRGADAIHPGYGFLSENADFARACEREGIVCIGQNGRQAKCQGACPPMRCTYHPGERRSFEQCGGCRQAG